MEKTKIIGNFYGIPTNGIEKMKGRWIPVWNKRFKSTIKKYRRRHTQRCPECGARVKNIQRHYRLYHRKFYEDFFIKPLEKAKIGELYGVRFVETKRIKNFKIDKKHVQTI